METFSWEPFDPPSVQYNHNNQVTTFADSSEQVYHLGRKPTVWTLTFQVSWAEMENIRDFYNARCGSYEKFYWDDPWSGTTKIVRFAEDSLDIETEYKLNGKFKIKLKEVI